MVRIPYIKIPSVRVGGIDPTSDIGTAIGGVQPAPITYLTNWKIVGNSEVHTLPYPDGIVLPDGYKRCKYLELYSTEYFDSGIIPEQGIGVSMTFKYQGEYQGEVKDEGIFGCRVSAYSADSLYCFRQAQTDKLFVSYGGKICDATTTGNFWINAGDEIELHLDSNSLSFTNGTNTFTQSHNYQITKGTNTLCIGRIKNYGYPSHILLITFILTNSVGDTIFNGIPCLDDSNVPCLYDTISQTTLYNQGTGTLGYEVEPQPTEIWSCGEYNPTDGKYHILVQPQGGNVADIALTEPLRKAGDNADTIEFPSDTDGKALVTRNLIRMLIGDSNIPLKLTTNTSDVYRWVIATDAKRIPSSTLLVHNVLSSKYDAVTANGTYICKQGVGIDPNGRVVIYDAEYTGSDDKENFKAANANVEVIYEAETPTTELVDAPQIEEAESYSMVISQGAKAVSWSGFSTE